MSQRIQPSLGAIAAEWGLKWNGEAYGQAVRMASLETVRKAVRVVRPKFRQLAPRAGKHRADRRYPNRDGSTGRLYTGEKRITQTIQSKTGVKRFQAYGFVKANVGYAVFQNFGFRIVARNKKVVGREPGKFFAQRALIESMDQVVPILRGEMPR